MDWKSKFYKIIRFLAIPTVGIVLPFKAMGRENIPDGPAIICANHSDMKDPILLAFAVPGKYHLCFMAKQELFNKRFVKWFFTSLGAFPVSRGKADPTAMRRSLQCLKSGKKLAIFPEGTRSSEDDAVAPKLGAVRFAEKTGAPIIPVYIPREKKLFHRTKVVFGEPLRVGKAAVRRTKKEYEIISDELMDRITKLRDYMYGAQKG